MFIVNKQYFIYGEKEINYLRSKDKILGKVIDEIGYVHRKVIPDIFMAIINSIIGQQISTKAHATVWGRFQTMFEPVTPEHIGSISNEELQSCGISMRKVSYIKEVTSSVLDGSLDLTQLRDMSDHDICKRLCQIKGIGAWTAEMLMIFSMQRMDVISRDDMALVRGLRMLYHHREITPELFTKYKKRYSPYATVASLYLWEISQGVCDGLVDPAPKTEVQKKRKQRK